MELIFGKGDILVTECGNAKKRHILIEQGKGVGVVGAATLSPDRMKGAIIPEEDFGLATVTLTFDNPVSVAVVLEKVLNSLVHFRRAGKTIGEGHDKLVESCREAMLEILGERDAVDK